MKITTKNLITMAAGIGLLVLTSAAQADQVKGGERMMQANGSTLNPVATTSDYKPMSCAHCQDVTAEVPDTTSKGLEARAMVAHGVPTTPVVSHSCGGCETRFNIVSHGKRSPSDTLTHTCSMSESCIIQPR